MTRLSQIQLWGFFSGWNKLHRSMHQPGSWLRLWRQRESKPHFPLLTSTAMAETSLTYMPFYLQKSFSVPYLSCSESCISLSAFCTSVNLASNGSVWQSSYITSPFQLGYGHSRNLSAFDYKENLYFSGCPAMKLHSCYFCFFSHHLSKQKRNSLCAVNNNKKKNLFKITLLHLCPFIFLPTIWEFTLKFPTFCSCLRARTALKPGLNYKVLLTKLLQSQAWKNHTLNWYRYASNTLYIHALCWHGLCHSKR